MPAQSTMHRLQHTHRRPGHTPTSGAHICTNKPNLQPYFLGQRVFDSAQCHPPASHAHQCQRFGYGGCGAALACSLASARPALPRHILLAHRERDSMASATNHSRNVASHSRVDACKQRGFDRQFPSSPFYSCSPSRAPAYGGVFPRPHAPPRRLPLIVCLLPSCHWHQSP